MLIHVSRNPQGIAVSTEETITGESIPIGRSASSKIRLLDHRVDLHHATVKRTEDGKLCIEGVKEAVITVNGFIEQNALLTPGMRIEIGPYVLIVEPAPDGHNIALSVEMLQPPPEQDITTARRTAPTTLAALGLSKRRLGFGLASIILLLFLLLPLMPSVSSAFDKWQATLPLTLTGSWSPGPFSDGHRMFGAKCSTCHQHPFQAIPDKACEQCHKQVAMHLADDDLNTKTFKDVRCTTCHLDHRGKAGLVLHDSSGCVACHGNIESKKTSTKLDDVHDFETGHPPFHITFPIGRKVARIRQDDKGKLAEKTGLKLNHQVHLDKKGLLSPKGNTVLVCRDCHKLEESGTHFAPMTMEKTCQQAECHLQYFTDPAEEAVPHGSERDVLNRLRELYARWLATSPRESKSACNTAVAPGNATERTVDCINNLARKTAATFFKENLECGQCHEIEPSGDNDVPWKVVQLHLNRDYQPGAVFSHSRHDTIDCTDCHDKTNSRLTSDVAMPTIGKCRECHAGDRDSKGKIRSACDSCHRFHKGAKTKETLNKAVPQSQG